MVAVYSTLLYAKADYHDSGPRFDHVPFEQATRCLNQNGSPGYPYTERFSKKGEVVQADERGQFNLRAFVMRRMTFSSTIFSVMGKHEVRDDDKVATDTMRTFVVGPICNNVLCIMATRRFYSAMAQVDGPFAIGMTWEHGGTTKFVERFRGPLYGADRPKWDGSVMPQIHDACNDFEAHFLDEQGTEMNFWVDSNEYQHFLLMHDGYVATCKVGEPSGGPKTTMRNSEANYLQFLYFTVSRFVTRFDTMPTHSQVNDNTEYYCYGDDSAHWCSDSWRSFCRPSLLNQEIARHKYECFYDNYDDELTSPCDTIFLSAVPVLIEGRYVARNVSHTKILCAMVTGCPKRVPPTVDWTWHEFQLSRVYQYATLLFADQRIWHAMQFIIADYETWVSSRYSTPHLRTIKRSYHLSWAECYALHTEPKRAQFLCVLAGRNQIHPDMSKNMKRALAEALTPRTGGLRNKGRVTGIRRSRSQSRPKFGNSAKQQRTPQEVAFTKATKTKTGSSSTQLVPIPAATGRILKLRRPKGKQSLMNELVTDELVTYIDRVAAPASAGAFGYAINGPINPGNSLFFPRIVALAQMYEKWRVENMSFEFIPNVGTGINGNYAMYVDYDPKDSSDNSMSAIVENKTSDICPVYIASSIRITDKGGWKYTQIQTTNTQTADDRLQTPGDFRFAIEGCTANSVIGSVLIRYKLRFKDPKPSSTNSIAYTALITSFPPSFTGYLGIDETKFVSQGIQPEISLSALQVATNASKNVFHLAAGQYGVYADCSYSGGDGASAVTLKFVTEGQISSQSILASGTSTSAATTLTLAATITVTAPVTGTSVQDMFALILTNASANTLTISTTRLRLLAVSSINNGLSVPKYIPPSSVSFSLPDQLVAARAYLGTLSGPVVISTPESVLEDSDRLTALETEIAALVISNATLRRLISPPPASRYIYSEVTPDVKILLGTPPLDKCLYCGENPPDHIGRDCPRKPLPPKVSAFVKANPDDEICPCCYRLDHVVECEWFPGVRGATDIHHKLVNRDEPMPRTSVIGGATAVDDDNSSDLCVVEPL
jgi:hypothetical protein